MSTQDGVSTPKQKALPTRPRIGSRATSYQSAVSEASNMEMDIDDSTGQDTPRPQTVERTFSLPFNIPKSDQVTVEQPESISSPKTIMSNLVEPSSQQNNKSLKKMPSTREVDKKSKEKDRDRKIRERDRRREKERGLSMVDGAGDAGEGSGDGGRSHSVVRDPMFGECANDAIELRQEKIERDKSKK